MTFRKHDDVAVIEYVSGNPAEDGPVTYGTVTLSALCSVTVRFDTAEDWYFMLDSQGRAWRESGRWRLVPVCGFCDMPILGTPVGEGDPAGRKWCTEECRTASAEGWGAQHYGAGVAT